MSKSAKYQSRSPQSRGKRPGNDTAATRACAMNVAATDVRQSPQGPSTGTGAAPTASCGSGGSAMTATLAPSAAGTKRNRTVLKLTRSASGPTL